MNTTQLYVLVLSNQSRKYFKNAMEAGFYIETHQSQLQECDYKIETCMALFNSGKYFELTPGYAQPIDVALSRLEKNAIHAIYENSIDNHDDKDEFCASTTSYTYTITKQKISHYCRSSSLKQMYLANNGKFYSIGNPYSLEPIPQEYSAIEQQINSAVNDATTRLKSSAQQKFRVFENTRHAYEAVKVELTSPRRERGQSETNGDRERDTIFELEI